MRYPWDRFVNMGQLRISWIKCGHFSILRNLRTNYRGKDLNAFLKPHSHFKKHDRKPL